MLRCHLVGLLAILTLSCVPIELKDLIDSVSASIDEDTDATTQPDGTSDPGEASTNAPLLVTGKVILPADSPISFESVNVATPHGAYSLAPDGGFVAEVDGTGPTLVSLLDSSNQVLLFGYVDATTGTGELSSRQSALALLFYAIGGVTIPPAQRAEVLAYLSQTPELAALAATVEATLSTNPTGLMDCCQMSEAVENATQSLHRPDRKVNTLKTVVASESLSSPRYLGIEAFFDTTEFVQDGGSQDSIVLFNYSRFPYYAFIYRTAWISDQGGDRQYISPPELMQEVLVLPGVRTCTGEQWVLKRCGGGDSSSPPIPLPIAVGHREERFEIEIVNTQSCPSTPNSDPREELWRTRRLDLQKMFAFEGILLPALVTLLMSNDQAIALYGTEQWGTLARELGPLFTEAVPNLATLLEQNHALQTLGPVFRKLAADGDLRTRLIEKLYAAAGGHPTPEQLASASYALSGSAGAGSILYAIERWFIDRGSPTCETWPPRYDVTTGYYKIQDLIPAEAVVAPSGPQASFTIAPFYAGSGSRPYTWTVRGQDGGPSVGILQDSKGRRGTTLEFYDVGLPTITYIADPIVPGSIDVVELYIRGGYYRGMVQHLSDP